jgi:hypothetical protein
LYQERPLLYPSDGPGINDKEEWFPAAFDYLNVDLGVEFVELVDIWVKLERSFHWRYGKDPLPSAGRPKVLSDWIKSGRYKAKHGGNGPKLKGVVLDVFSGAFDKWWQSLKPKGDDWTSLNRPGPNGWLSLLAGLKWWGLALEEEQSDAKKRWLEVVSDHSVVLNALLKYREQNF